MKNITFKTAKGFETVKGEIRSISINTSNIIVNPCKEYPKGAEFNLPTRCIIRTTNA